MPTRVVIKKLRAPPLTDQTQQELFSPAFSNEIEERLFQQGNVEAGLDEAYKDDELFVADSPILSGPVQQVDTLLLDEDMRESNEATANNVNTAPSITKNIRMKGNTNNEQHRQGKKVKSILPSFKSSSLLRELNVRTKHDDNDDMRHGRNSHSKTMRQVHTQYPNNNRAVQQMHQLSPSGNIDNNTIQQQQMLMISDIRGSPRILGYLFSAIASAVMLVSVVQFYRQRKIDVIPSADTNYDNNDRNDYYYFLNGIVVKWKLWAAIYVSSIGAGLSLFIIYIHFDTMVAPDLWHMYFRNGSTIEQCIIVFFIIYWAVAVHLCTSTLSVGESQANVYFATWIAFVASAMNYGVWCESAAVVKSGGKSNITTETGTPRMGYGGGEGDGPITSPKTKSNFVFFDNLLHGNYNTSIHSISGSSVTSQQNRHHHSSGNVLSSKNATASSEEFHSSDLNYRETTYNWVWVGFFSCIFAGAATDLYWNRDNIRLRFKGDDLNLMNSDWVVILSVVWSEVALCGVAIFLNTQHNILSTCSCRLPRFLIHGTKNVGGPNKSNNKRYRCLFGWRQLEGLVILITTGLKFWVILRYASVDGVIRGLSNAYFGVWGSFFNGVFCFGTWIRENKNFEYIVHD